MKHQSAIKKIVPLVVLALVVTVIAVSVEDVSAYIKRLGSLSIEHILLIAALVILTFIGNGIKNILLLRPFDIHLRFMEWCGLAVINNFWNYLPFQGGLMAKGAYLKRTRRFSYTRYVAMSSGSYLITFFTYGLTGVIMLGAYFVWTGSFALAPLLVYGILLLVAVVGFGTLWAVNGESAPNGLFGNYIRGAQSLFSHRWITVQLIAVDVALLLVYVVRLGVCFYALGLNAPIVFIILVAPASLLSIFVTITPGGLVVRESLIGLFAFWFGVVVADSVLASFVDRAVVMAVVFPLGTVFTYWLTRRAMHYDNANPPLPMKRILPKH